MRIHNSNFIVRCLKAQGVFLWVSAFILLLTALIKIVTARQSIPLLLIHDPVFPFLNKRQIFDCAAAVELLIVCILAWRSVEHIRLFAVAWISGCFIAYHLGLILVGAPQSYCPCLGSIGGYLGISDNLLGRISFLIACFLWCGSLLFLFIEFITAGNKNENSSNVTPVR